MPLLQSAPATALNPAGATFMVLSIGGVLTLLIYCYRRILTATPGAPDRQSPAAADDAPTDAPERGA